MDPHGKITGQGWQLLVTQQREAETEEQASELKYLELVNPRSSKRPCLNKRSRGQSRETPDIKFRPLHMLVYIANISPVHTCAPHTDVHVHVHKSVSEYV